MSWDTKDYDKSNCLLSVSHWLLHTDLAATNSFTTSYNFTDEAEQTVSQMEDQRPNFALEKLVLDFVL